jgi:hypothetical protein
MRRTRSSLSLALCAVLVAASPQPAATPHGMRITVPGGTAFKVEVVDKVSSATANVGDTFAVAAASDVYVNGWLVIAKGAAGQGEVLTVDRAGAHGHPGSLGIQLDWIYVADGEKVHLTSQRKNEQGEGKEGAASTMTIVSWAFLGLPGLFAHNFVKGRDVELDSTHQLDAFVADTVHVVATVKEGDDPGFAH